jgi:hypothetical protein
MPPLVTALYMGLLGYFTMVKSSSVIESSADQEARLATIARATDEACRLHPLPGFPHHACLALSATVSVWESGLLRDVHAGDHVGPAGERCLDQIHRRGALAMGVEREEWMAVTGLDPEATLRCKVLGTRILAHHVRRCGFKFDGGSEYIAARIFVEYHLPSPWCKPRAFGQNAWRRAGFYKRLLKRLEKEAQ